MPFRIKISICLIFALGAVGVQPALAAAAGSIVNLPPSARLESCFTAATLSNRPATIRPQAPTNAEPLRGNPLTDPLAFTSAEALLFSDSAAGKLNNSSLIEAALIACGLSDSASLAHYQAKYDAARELLMHPANRSDRSDFILGQIESIHRVLYQKLLGNYNADATDLAATLDTGVYNCASATLLFVALGQDMGLDAEAVELPGHVRAVVETPSRRYEVEVTCPTWPDAVKDYQAASAIRAGGSLNQESAIAGRLCLPEAEGREVSPLGLLAMIYYNRGIDAFNQQRFSEAVADNRRALLLDPNNRLAYGNLLAAVNNWAVALGDLGEYSQAEALLAEGRQFDPAHLPFAHNADHIRQLEMKAQPAHGG